MDDITIAAVSQGIVNISVRINFVTNSYFVDSSYKI